MSITTERTAEIVKEFGANEKDTGNPCVQVALLTERINNLTAHLKANKKDKHTHRGLMILVGKRKRLVDYVKSKDLDMYRDLIARVGMRK